MQFSIHFYVQVIKNKKERYLQNKAKGIIPPTIDEISKSAPKTENYNVLANEKTLADTVFKGYRDDLDFNDENDVGKHNTIIQTYEYLQQHYKSKCLS